MMCSSSVDEEQTLIDSKTLICVKSEEIKPVEANPFPETMADLSEDQSIDRSNSDEVIAAQVTETLEIGEIGGNAEDEIPVLDFSNSGEILGGCSMIVDETLEEIPEIKQFGNSISESGEIGENVDAKTLEKNPQFVDNNDTENNDVQQLAEPPIEDMSRFNRPYYTEGERKRCRIYGPRVVDTRNDFVYEEDEPCRVGAGLNNLGNTCFLNVVMQCFTHTVPLVQALLSLKHEASSHGYDEFCVLCAVRYQIEHSISYSGKKISPSILVNNLSNISSCFHRYQQEDAHEFLQCLLDKLDNNWSKHEPNDSLVKQVFGGRLVSQLRCCKCGYHSDNYEPMNDLSLEIEDVDDLESAFKSFTKVENLEDMTTCDQCKEKVQREKQLLLDQAPPIAALHLKRFKSDGIYVEKIDRMVKYPLELDLSPYTKAATNDNDDLKYELYGFVVHVGVSSTSGHYFCYIRTSPDKWYRFDDAQVTKVSEETALDQEAYILFYARKGTPWFSGVFDKWKARLNESLNTSPISVLDATTLPSTSFHDSDTFDNRDATPVTHAEPLCCLRPNDVDTHDHTAAPEPSTPANYGEDVSGHNHERKTRNISLEGLFESDDEDHVVVKPKDDVEIDLSIADAPGSPGIYTDEEELATVTEDAYQIPLAHLNSQKKELSFAQKTVRDAKRDMERKEAAKYVKTSSMPIARRQMLMAAINSSPSDRQSKKKRNASSSSSNHKHSANKRVKNSPKHPLRTVSAIV